MEYQQYLLKTLVIKKKKDLGRYAIIHKTYEAVKKTQ